MSFRRPLILGVGSLGSILSEKIVNDEFFDKLSILDYDVVKERNLNNSIFTFEDIGKKKTNVIKNRFSNLKNIDIFDLKFIENLNNYLFDCDIIIDCRDFLYNRKNIDIRLFVCNKSLIMDCRKKVNYETSYEGSYFWNIKKDELDKLLEKFVNLLKDLKLKDVIKKEEINEINLNDGNFDLQCINYNNDLLIDRSDKISNPQFISKLDKNKECKVNIYSNNNKTKTKTLDLENKNNLHIIKSLEELLPKFDNNCYIILVNKNEISLIPETGAA